MKNKSFKTLKTILVVTTFITSACSKSGTGLNCELCQPAGGGFSAVELCDTGNGSAQYRIDGELGETVDLDGLSVTQFIETFCQGN